MKRILLLTPSILLCVLFLLSSCGVDSKKDLQQQYYESARRPTDSIMGAVFRAHEPERALALVDSFEQSGAMSKVRADYYRASAYTTLGDNPRAKAYYHRVVSAGQPTLGDSWVYERSGYRLAQMLYDETQYEGALRVAIPVLDYLDSLGVGQKYAKAGLITVIGCSQIKLGQWEQARERFQQLNAVLEQWLGEDQSGHAVLSSIEFGMWICSDYLAERRFDEAKVWADRTESYMPAFIARFEPVAPEDVSNIRASVDMLHIRVEQGLGHARAAAREYDRFKTTPYAGTTEGKMKAVDYLMAAGRYAEAADCLSVLDAYTAENEIDLSLDWLGEKYFPKLRANIQAGRIDSALFVASQIAAAYDTALVHQKRSAATEMATLFDLQGKEQQIEKQHSQLQQQRIWGIVAALVLVVAFFFFYDLHRRRASRKLAAAHASLEKTHTELQSAYNQLEETTAAKERIESELRIARDIQLSMVPTTFPEIAGLDLYATMLPARAVGGDLYDLVLLDDKLYFCVGDVSGKGVPASLFMAQSVRLFHTFAKEGLMPADIARRMNVELSQNNEQNMFVTLFIGMLTLSTGRMDFCNCGHNPPVLDGDFLEMRHRNMVLGIFEGSAFEGEHIDDIRGKRLLVYTDGLNEAENRNHALLGNDRVLALMAEAAELPARQVIESLTQAVDQYREGFEPNDDLTLLYLRMALPCR